MGGEALPRSRSLWAEEPLSGAITEQPEPSFVKWHAQAQDQTRVADYVAVRPCQSPKVAHREGGSSALAGKPAEQPAKTRVIVAALDQPAPVTIMGNDHIAIGYFSECPCGRTS